MPGSRIVAGIVFLFGVICVEAVRQTANLRYAETIEFLGSDPMWPRRFVVRLKKSDAPEKFVAALKNTKNIKLDNRAKRRRHAGRKDASS